MTKERYLYIYFLFLDGDAWLILHVGSKTWFFFLLVLTKFRFLWWKKNVLVVAQAFGSCLLVILTRLNILCILIYVIKPIPHNSPIVVEMFPFWGKIIMSASFGSFQSEDIFTGAIREVKEETGVRIFLNIITMNIVAC